MDTKIQKGQLKAYLDILDLPTDFGTIHIEDPYFGMERDLVFPSPQKKFRKQVSDGRKSKKVAKSRAANKRAKQARKKNR